VSSPHLEIDRLDHLLQQFVVLAALTVVSRDALSPLGGRLPPPSRDFRMEFSALCCRAGGLERTSIRRDQFVIR
jgi:hypothetical protein